MSFVVEGVNLTINGFSVPENLTVLQSNLTVLTGRVAQLERLNGSQNFLIVCLCLLCVMMVWSFMLYRQTKNSGGRG